MAGDWIPWVKGLTRRAEIIKIASAADHDRRWVSSVMMELWEWADSESTDGFIPAVAEAAALTRIIPDTSADLWAAVEAAGWIRFRNGGLEIPNFDRWLGECAKKRLQDAQRKRKDRKKASAFQPDKNGTPVLFSSVEETKNSSGEDGGPGEGGDGSGQMSAFQPDKNGTPVRAQSPVPGQSWPSFLATEFAFWFRGTQASERNVEKLAGTFEALMDRHRPEAILAGIQAAGQRDIRTGRKDRQQDQTSWQFIAWLDAREGKEELKNAKRPTTQTGGKRYNPARHRGHALDARNDAQEPGTSAGEAAAGAR